jgi:ABC-2 type transport system ATP-binding protein
MLDEPTSGLDPEFRVVVREIVNELRAKREATVLISSHLLGELEEMIDHLVLIRAGRVVKQGALSGLLAGQGAVRYRVRAEPLELVRELLAELAPVDVDGALVFSVDTHRVPDVVAALVARGVRIYEVSEQRRTLEELYIEAVPK